MLFKTEAQAEECANTINHAFAKRGYIFPVFIVKQWAYGWEVVELRVQLPK